MGEYKKRCITFTAIDYAGPIEDYQNEQLLGTISGTPSMCGASTTKPPTATDVPTTTTEVITSTGSGLSTECRQENVYYEGTIRQIGRWKTAKNADKCEKKCKNKSFCVGWTYFPNIPDVEFKKRCKTFTQVDYVGPIEDYQNEQLLGTISGTPSKCT